jgi:hypothetical protein
VLEGVEGRWIGGVLIHGDNARQRRVARVQYPPEKLFRGVAAMTSDVKSWSQLFLGLHAIFSPVHRKRRSQSETTVDLAAIRGLGTT